MFKSRQEIFNEIAREAANDFRFICRSFDFSEGYRQMRFDNLIEANESDLAYEMTESFFDWVNRKGLAQ